MTDQARWLDADATAEYLCVRVTRLQALVKERRIPPANYALGPRSPRWDRAALDAAFEGGAASSNQSAMVKAYGQKLLEKGRARRPIQAR